MSPCCSYQWLPSWGPCCWSQPTEKGRERNGAWEPWLPNSHKELQKCWAHSVSVWSIRAIEIKHRQHQFSQTLVPYPAHAENKKTNAGERAFFFASFRCLWACSLPLVVRAPFFRVKACYESYKRRFWSVWFVRIISGPLSTRNIRDLLWIIR